VFYRHPFIRIFGASYCENQIHPSDEHRRLPIAEIEFDVFNRHELVPILMALQHVYVNRPQLLEEICTLIQADIARQPNPKLGCKGLTHWEVLVLSALRLGANLDYDQLSDLAGCHSQIRHMMGLSVYEPKRYPKARSMTT